MDRTLDLDRPRLGVARDGDGSFSIVALVRHTGGETAVSIHVYGTDVSRIGSSVRRCYGPA